MERNRTLDSSMSSLYSSSNISHTPTTQHYNDNAAESTPAAVAATATATATAIATTSPISSTIRSTTATIICASSPTPSSVHMLLAKPATPLPTTTAMNVHNHHDHNRINTNVNTVQSSNNGGNVIIGTTAITPTTTTTPTATLIPTSTSISTSTSIGGINLGRSECNGGLRATTIGTVVVRCGPIQLVIALLQSVEKLYIKVVELEPKITKLGANLDESLNLQKDHDETLTNIQNLPGPMEEFIHKADKLLASKRISSELVNAMADTLNIIWSDILNLLKDRQHILHLCTQFHEKMLQCEQYMDQLEVACTDTTIPIDVTSVQELLNKFKQLRIDMLTGVMAALKDGNEFIAQLQELENMESLDTRPEHIKRDAARAVHQVQQWLESLHDRRNALEIAWQTRKTQLEQCLGLALLGRELLEVESDIEQQRQKINDALSLGECEQTANKLLQQYKEYKHQALALRDRALKITRSKEKLQESGTFSGDEACLRAFDVLSTCTDHLDLVDQREHWLQQSRDYFAKAEQTLKGLENLEVQLSNVKLPTNTPESFAMYSKIAKDIKSFTEEPLKLGYNLLDEVGRTEPATQGVRRVQDEIENRKVYIERICAHSTEDHRKVQEALEEFLKQFNDLLEWLKLSGQNYLQQNILMGTNLEESKQFLMQHHELMQDLEIKGELINLLLESIKAHLESFSAQQRFDVDSKAEILHNQWIELKDLVLKRVDFVSVLIEFFEKANELASQLDNLRRQLLQTPNEQKMQFLQETWKTMCSNYNNLKVLGSRFLNWKILDPYLVMRSSAIAVEDILNDFSKQQIDVTTSLDDWTAHIAERHEIEIILEKIIMENEETTNKTTKVNTQLYPIFSSTSVDAKYLHVQTDSKLKSVLQDIDQAQHDIEERIQTTLGLQLKDPEAMHKIEQVLHNLYALKTKLDGIRYDYKSLIENILQFLNNIIQLKHNIDEYFTKQQQQLYNETIERCIAEHERFRDLCTEKFRSLITQSELLIDRVRSLEPTGSKEIDTDRILKLLENLRLHFDTCNSERIVLLERLERVEQFKSDLNEIHHGLNSVTQQLNDINNQSVDSLASAKTTTLAFEYFERTLELLEKRINKFSETSKEQLLITSPESEAFVLEQLLKLQEKWQKFKEQVIQKRSALQQSIDFFEVVEKIDAEYREINYFYNSVSNKVPYLRDSVEAGNLLNDIEKYVAKWEIPLREKLDNAAKSPYDMNKISQLHNDVTTIFQKFYKLKADINLLQEHLKSEEREREQREREERDLVERECAKRVAEERERILREEQAHLQALREQAAREQAERKKTAQELAAREKAIREEEQRLLAARQQVALEQATRKEEELSRLRALREEEARLQASREQAKREQLAREEAAREAELKHLQTLREEEMRIQRLREQAMREEEQRLVAMREQAKLQEAARLKALHEEENRLQSLRETSQYICIARDQIDHKIIQSMSTSTATANATATRTGMNPEIFAPLKLKYELPTFTQHLTPGITRESEKFTFTCTVKGTPEPRIEWYKDGVPIKNNADYKTSYSNGLCRLDIEETFTADSGRYTCRACNLVGVAESSAELLVRENITDIQMRPPRIIQYLENGRVKEGHSYEFKCIVTGNPLPTVNWFKNDKCIDDLPDYAISYNNGEAKLCFQEAFIEDDAIYTCRAKNAAGVEHCSAHLTVERLAPKQKPFFKIPLSNIMARIGQKVKLEALIGGTPMPEIFWQHNGSPYYPRQMKYEYGHVTLIIPQVYLNDSGVYKLIAKNLAGEAFSTCNVTVKGRTANNTSDSEMASDMEPIKPSVQVSLKDVAIFEGKALRLDCVIVGQPEPEVIWYHNDKPVKESQDIQLLFQGDRCSLIIQEVYQDDSGNYKVVAINSAGETSSSCEVKVTPLNVLEPATRPQAEPLSLPSELEPKFEKFLSDILVHEGESVAMEVICTGNKPMSAKWYQVNHELNDSDRIHIESNENSGVFKLTINNVTADDKGVYTVKVTNSAGDAKCFSQLIVKSVNIPESQRSQQVELQEKLTPPEFKEKFTDKTVHPDEVVKFECIVKGKPKPKIHWYFNDKPVQGHNFLVSTSGEREVLTITKVAEDTVGKIACVAENDAGRGECIAFLGLIGSGLACMPAQADTLIIRQDHDTDSSMVSIRKQTFTSTSTTSQVSSSMNGDGITPQTEIHQTSAHYDKSVQQMNNQRPEIIETQRFQELHKDKNMSSPTQQQKTLTFVQTSHNGIEEMSTTMVPSLATNARKEMAPRFTTPLTGKIVDQGVDVTLEALYEGFPSPDVKIIRNGEELFENERLKITNKCHRITIDLKNVNINDAGRYAITATNSAGQTTSTADLVVKKTIFPPVFGKRLQAQVIKKNERIIMEVEVTGLPEPTVIWLKDDKPLKDANISTHRLLSQGNTHKLIIEKGQLTDSGKYTVQATNPGGEAKSIADCAIVEGSPDRNISDGIKLSTTYGDKLPSEFKTENFNKEPQSFETKHREITTIDNEKHGLSESTITTEHRCTTEATMRLEHKPPTFYDLPDVSQLNTKTSTPISTTTTTTTSTTTTISNIVSNELPPSTIMATSTIATITTTTQSQSLSPSLKSTSTPTPSLTPTPTPTATPPPPPPPSSSLNITNVDVTDHVTEHLEIVTNLDNNNVETLSTTIPTYMKLIPPPVPPKPSPTATNDATTPSTESSSLASLQTEIVPSQSLDNNYKKFDMKSTPPITIDSQPISLGEDVKSLSALSEKQIQSEKSVCGDIGAKPIKPQYSQLGDNLPTPSRLYTRSPSPKPSAEGLAMEKLWTPNNHVSGYETGTSDVEQSEYKLRKLLTPTKELSAPYLVKQVTRNAPFYVSPTMPRIKSPIDDIYLQPGTPPEICYAPEVIERRPSLVGTMEKKLEQYIKDRGPKKVIPHSVPTLTPNPDPSGFKSISAPIKSIASAYKTPPSFTRHSKSDYYESDYESDRRKYSGSESDDIGFRSPQKYFYQSTPSSNKTNGYAADTEELSSYSKMESSTMEKKSTFYESNKDYRDNQPLLSPCFEQPRAPSQQFYFTKQTNDGGQNKQESYSASEDKYHHEDKNYKCTSMTKNISYQMSSSATTVPQYRSVKPPVSTLTPTPTPTQRKTPAEFSDYSSEVDDRFRSMSRNYESETDTKGYRVVYPPTPQPQPKINGYKSPVISVTPSSMEFQPIPPRSKFEPLKKEVHHDIRTDFNKTTTRHYQTQQQENYQKQQQHQQRPQQTMFKPKPVAAKYLASAQQHHEQNEYKSQSAMPQQHSIPSTQPKMYYKGIAGTPLHTAKLATETQNIMHMKECTETSQRVVNMQQTKKVIHFDEDSNIKKQQLSTLESFPCTPTPTPRVTPSRQKVPPPSTPTKFMPGEFHESYYDNEIKNAKIAPMWTPMGEYGPLRYRHVEPPRPGRSYSLPRTYERVLSPMEFDRGPEMPTKIHIDPNSIRRDRSSGITASPTQRHSHSQSRQVSSSSSVWRSNEQQQYKSNLYEKQQQYQPQSQNFSRDDMNLKVGSPPRYGYIPPQLEQQSKTMNSTFKKKTHRFIEDVSNDLQNFKTLKSSTTYADSSESKVMPSTTFRSTFRRAPSEGYDNKSQAYRDEARVSQYGTKCVDPNTGLVYFKYDFGYEFGILFPGKGHKFVTNQWNKTTSSTLPKTTSQELKGYSDQKSMYPLTGVRGELNIPVQHDYTKSPYNRGSTPNLSTTKDYNTNTETISRQNSTKHFYGPTYPSFNTLPQSQKRFSLPNTKIIDINIDRLHENESLQRFNYTDRTVQEEPVNAHLNRDEYTQKSPTFITPLKDRIVMSGQRARFECIVQSHPQPQIAWHRNNYDLKNSQKHLQEYKNGVCRLTIMPAYPDDAGSYTCSASNPLGSAATTAELKITTKSSILGGGSRF